MTQKRHGVGRARCSPSADATEARPPQEHAPVELGAGLEIRLERGDVDVGTAYQEYGAFQSSLSSQVDYPSLHQPPAHGSPTIGFANCED